MVVNAINDDARLDGVLTPLPVEGGLLPETYFFTRGADPNDLLSRMMQAREIRFATLWSERQQGLPFTSLEEAVVLASIIEKEQGLPVNGAGGFGIRQSPAQGDETAIRSDSALRHGTSR